MSGAGEPNRALSKAAYTATPNAPLLLGHRGAPRQARENTVEAFRLALEAGLDGLETDVQRTADGALVLHHDDALADGAAVASLPSADLRERAPHVPELDDLVGVMLEFPTAVLNLELKAAVPVDDGRAADLCSHLAAWPVAVVERTWVSTFDAELLQQMAENLVGAGLNVPLAFLVAQPSSLPLVPSLPLAAVHPHHALVTSERMHEWRVLGLKVNAWTVNDPELAARLLALGVDGLIGDDPELLLAQRR